MKPWITNQSVEDHSMKFNSLEIAVWSPAREDIGVIAKFQVFSCILMK